MTTLFVCAVKDSAVGAFARPIFVPSVALAVRSFTDEVNRSAPDNQMNAHPDDFELHLLAAFEEETGKFTEEKRLLTRAKDVKRED